MESSTLLELIGLFIGTGGLTGFIVALLTIRYERQKAKGEAHSAKYDGMKVEQDTYQELIEDLRKDRQRLKEENADQQTYINELKAERKQLREERNELRNTIVEMRKELQSQGDKLARLGRIVNAMKPLICASVGCKTRETDIIGMIADDSFDIAPEEKGK